MRKLSGLLGACLGFLAGLLLWGTCLGSSGPPWLPWLLVSLTTLNAQAWVLARLQVQRTLVNLDQRLGPGSGLELLRLAHAGARVELRHAHLQKLREVDASVLDLGLPDWVRHGRAYAWLPCAFLAVSALVCRASRPDAALVASVGSAVTAFNAWRLHKVLPRSLS